MQNPEEKEQVTNPWNARLRQRSPTQRLKNARDAFFFDIEDDDDLYNPGEDDENDNDEGDEGDEGDNEGDDNNEEQNDEDDTEMQDVEYLLQNQKI